ncbi:hypothetical protein LOCC1_G004135 [Lachnellula occidentalis]|uniref:Uncharacterized protein n=1 Tax=Lachnellula occidentalis TaxID=215460 RepID=A0A8H8UHR7_9HELO|nr:hypothetical protein LOCC1_G004135 [Lachnellula occidentalis]
MEGPQKHNINELLSQGFFTTRKGKSPSRPTAPTTLPRESSFLRTPLYEPRDRSRSRTRSRPPPRPTVEHEVVSLAREYSRTARHPSYDPPLRGIIDQVPIILEADVTKAEAARLQAQPIPKSTDDNAETRFVLIPKSDTYSPNEEDDYKSGKPKDAGKSKTPKVEAIRDEKKDTLPKPTITRRRSRLDLPSLETKLPKDIPPKYRRSASAYASTPKDHDVTPKAQGSRPSEPFLSPAVSRGKNDYFGSAPPPRQSTQETGRAANGNKSSSRPVSPTAERRNSGNFESYQSRQNTNEKLTKPHQLSEEYGSRRHERHASTHSDRLSAGRSSRSSNRSSRHFHSSSSDEIADSDSDKEYRRYEHKSHKAIREEDGHNRHLRSPSRSNRSSMEKKGTSSYNSPYGSPKVSPRLIPKDQLFERSETFPGDRRRDISRPVSPLSPSPDTSRTDRPNLLDATKSRPRSRSSAPAPKPPPAPFGGQPSLPIPIPLVVNLLGENRKPPVIPKVDEQRSASARPDANPKPEWSPGTFQPPSNNLQKPVGSFRRYSEDMEKGSIVPLPSCPRTNYTRGRNDWLTLPNCPSFDICPSCFTSSIVPTDFRTHFIPAPRRSADAAVICDFGSSPWYRIAWLLTLKEKRQSLKLFYGLANIAANEPPCLGKHEAARKWHSIIDPRTGSDIYNFDVCSSCVKSVETLLPAIKGVFVRTDSHGPSLRVCDLRFDSPRFIQYFDALEITADRADYHDKDPDMRDFASLARRFAKLDECPQSTDLVDKKWHFITQLPEFTVCPECYHEIVQPEVDDRKPIPLLFCKDPKRINGKASCQLYSARMRGLFRTAVDADDYKLLASKARERRTVEAAWKANLSELRRKERAGLDVRGEIRRVDDEWERWE